MSLNMIKRKKLISLKVNLESLTWKKQKYQLKNKAQENIFNKSKKRNSKQKWNLAKDFLHKKKNLKDSLKKLNKK